MKTHIECKNIKFESSKEEPFYDVQLKVKKPTILNGSLLLKRVQCYVLVLVLNSFEDYVSVEELDGENMYDAGIHGLQPAQKVVKFLSFPPVLHLQLLRFKYDKFKKDTEKAVVKLNDR